MVESTDAAGSVITYTTPTTEAQIYTLECGLDPVAASVPAEARGAHATALAIALPTVVPIVLAEPLFAAGSAFIYSTTLCPPPIPLPNLACPTSARDHIVDQQRYRRIPSTAMAIIKNPFRKQDENVRPSPTPLTGEKPASSASSKQFNADAKDPVEYKLSGTSTIDWHILRRR